MLALPNELFNVFPILFHVKVCVVIKHGNFQYFSIKLYVADRYKSLLTAAILDYTHNI